MSELTRAPPQALAQRGSAEQVREQLHAARARLARRLEAVENQVSAVARGLSWREAVRRHPYLCAGGALVVGYALGRLFSRK